MKSEIEERVERRLNRQLESRADEIEGGYEGRVEDLRRSVLLGEQSAVHQHIEELEKEIRQDKRTIESLVLKFKLRDNEWRQALTEKLLELKQLRQQNQELQKQPFYKDQLDSFQA
jgi:hypothetical protein